MTSSRLMLSVLAVFALVLAFSPTANGLKCYICNTKFNDSCQSNPPQKYLQDCETMRHKLPPEDHNASFTICRIMTISTSNEPTHIDRRCGWLKGRKECYNTATFQIKSTTCECDKDACNSAPYTAPSLLTLLGFSALFALRR